MRPATRGAHVSRLTLTPMRPIAASNRWCKLGAVCALALLIVVSAAVPAGAAGLSIRPPGSRVIHAGGAGVPAAVASTQALAAELSQATGLTPSQVTSQNVCAPAAQGFASCAAQALVTRSDHQPVRPHADGRRTFTQVFPSVRRGITPQAATPAAAGGPPAPLTPAYLQQAYDLTYLSQTKGVGDTIALVDAYHDPTAEADLAVYRANFGLPACTTANGCFKQMNDLGTTSPMPPRDSNWETEISLDLDAVSALCPNCKIRLYEGLTNSVNDLVTAANTAATDGANQISNSWLAYWSGSGFPGTMVYPGIPVIAATGDHGYNTAAGSANYPAALPGVTAAGGTSLAPAGDSKGGRGFGESAWSLVSGWGAASGCNTLPGVTKPSYQTDTGCTGRSYSDVSAVADPGSGLNIYDSGNGGWMQAGGTSLATPLIAAYEAITGTNGASPKWAYDEASLLNDPVTGSVGSCPAAYTYICNARVGYDGPTGMGSISGAVASGAPGIGWPSVGAVVSTYTKSYTATSATLVAGVYPNSFDTTYFWQYGATNAYGQQTPTVDIGSGRAPVASSDIISGLTPNTLYHYRLVAQNSAGTSYGYDYTVTTLPATSVPPSNLTPPTITGTPQQGQTLVGSNGTWTTTVSAYTYQWQRSTDNGSTWSTISGANTSNYVPGAGDLAAKIRLTVTAINANGQGSATAAAVGPVTPGTPPVSTAPPAITGTAQQGQTLSASNGTWANSPTAYTYQWQRSADTGLTWIAVAGANAATYTPVAADIGSIVRVSVTATNAYGSPTALSAWTNTIASGAPHSTGAPTIVGIVRQGQVLTASTGSWNPTGTAYAYQWQRSADNGQNWTSITGASSATYTPLGADIGTTLRINVTATNPYGTLTATSPATALVSSGAPFSTSPPVIAGAPHQGQVLTVASTWNPAGTTYAYQWQRSADNAQTWTNIGGATTTGYTLTVADENALIHVVVSAINGYGQSSATSAPLGPVTASPPVNVTAPVLTGTTQRTYALTATQGTWTGPGISCTYQWQRSVDGGTSWSNITAATSVTYMLGVADEGTSLRMLVTATNVDGAASAPSNATQIISPYPPASVTAPAITGTAQRSSKLTASQGTWTGPGNVYSYQWQQDFGEGYVDIQGATASAYTLAVADEGSTVRVLVTATNADAAVVETSQPTTVVLSALPISTAAPTIAGTVQRTEMLTATAGAWTGVGNAYAYQWQRSTDGITWTNITGASALTYTLGVADERSSLRMLVTATNSDGTSNAVSTATATVPSAPPVSTGAPSIAGTARRSSTLTASQGTWSGIGNAYAYQWQRDPGSGFANVTGATSATYTLGVADEGANIRVLVTATNLDGTATAPSAASQAVQSAPPVNSAVPTITGTAARASILTATQGTWMGIGNTYAYQWQRSFDSGHTWTNITDTTASTYTLAVADENSAVRVVVIASNPDGTLSVASSATTTIPSSPPGVTAQPTISGTPQRASMLSTTQGTWTGIGNTYTYQWQRSTDAGTSWTAITGATDTSYTIAPADEHAKIRALVTAANPDGTLAVPSATTTTIPASPPANTNAPTVTGTPQRTQVLTAAQGTWTGIGNTYAYQWQHSSDSGVTWTAIVGATSATYTIAVSDENATVRVLVTGSNPDGTSQAASAATITVPPAPPVNTSPPTVSGTAQRASTLTASPGTWTGIGNTYAYQWQHSTDNGVSWVNIAAATSSSYTVQVADESSKIRALITASNPDSTVYLGSAPTASIPIAPPVSTALPTITGTAQRASVLAATQGAWTGIGNSYAYQWQRDSGSGFVNVTGATDSAYTIQVADENAKLRVLVSAANPDGLVVAPSAATTTIPSAPPLNTAGPAIAGTAQRSSTLTAVGGTWSGIGNTYAFQWQRSTDNGGTWTAINAATSSVYTLVLADVGTKVRVLVTATNPDGTLAVASAASALVQAGPPLNSAVPTISGTAQRASTLNVTQGTWTGIGNTYTYQWQRSTDAGTSWTAITGATDTSYTIAPADEHAKIRALVTAANPDGTLAVPSATTTTIPASPPANTNAPTVTGTPQRTQVLTAAQGTWTGIGNTYAYQWQRSGDAISWTNITGASDSTYKLGLADENQQIRVLVSAANPDATLSVPSAATTTVQSAPPVPSVLPVLTGTAQRTYSLSATRGVWSGPDNAYSFKWQRSVDGGASWTDIPGEVANTYQLALVDENAIVRAFVTATNPDGSAGIGSPASSPIAAAPPVVSASDKPTIRGAARLAGTLAATTGSWTPAGATFTYDWQRTDTNGVYHDIGGATGSSYALTQSDAGQRIRVIVTAANTDGSANAASSPTATVLQPPKLTKGPAAPSGTLMDSYELTADTGSWDTPGSSFSYSWVRCPQNATLVDASCSAVGVGQTYTLTSADVGHELAANVSASSAGGSSAPVASALTATVVGRPLTNITPPSISGDPQIPNKLTADQGSWSVPTTSVAYVWYRCGQDGSSNCTQIATGAAQYTLAAADQDHAIVLEADVTSPGRSASANSRALLVQDQPLPQVAVAPALTGTAARLSTLTGTPGAWTNNPTLTSVWQRCAGDGTGCQTVAGASALTYKLTDADEGHRMTLLVTATNSTGSRQASAQPSAVVAGVPPVSTHVPAIRGVAQQGVSIGFFDDTWQATADTTFVSSWQRCDADGKSCQTIAGAASTVYTPVSADVGHTLIAVVTAANPDGSARGASDPTAVVLPALPRWKTLPTVSAPDAQIGTSVTATAGVWSGGPMISTETTQMMRCTSNCVPVGTANADSYTITIADLGAILRVRDTASNAGGTTVTWSSRYIGPVSSAAAGSGVLAAATVPLRNAHGQTLATASFGAPLFRAQVTHVNPKPVRTVNIRRARGVVGKLKAWACPVASNAGGPPPVCSRTVTFGAKASLQLPSGSSGKVRIVVIKRSF